MARVTVEDCIDKVPNRFELVMLAAQRARDLSVGAEITVDRDNDKNPVVALREIAEETVSLDDLQEGLVLGLQKHADIDDPEEEAADLLAMEEEIAASAMLAEAETPAAPEEAAAADDEPRFEDIDPAEDVDADLGGDSDKEAD